MPNRLSKLGILFLSSNTFYSIPSGRGLPLSEVSSGPDFYKDWLKETPTSGWESFWEWSSFVPWLPLSKIRDVSGAVPGWTRGCGFWTHSSSGDKAPKMRPSLLLNSQDSFCVTLASTSSDTWVKNSSWTLKKFVFRAWSFLGSSSWSSLLTAGNFLLFLRVVISEERKKYSAVF